MPKPNGRLPVIAQAWGQIPQDDTKKKVFPKKKSVFPTAQNPFPASRNPFTR